MSSCCGLPFLECVYCLVCGRWVWKKLLYTAGNESKNWGIATAAEFEPVPRMCRYILAVYEEDLRNPIWAPPGGYGMNPDWVVLRRSYEETQGRVSPYLIYLDQDNADIVLLIRGLNLAKESDYLVLLDNKLGQTKFDGGYVHNGLLRAAQWVFDAESEILRELIERHPSYTLTFAGHSLGAGAVALLAMLVIQNRGHLGNIERNRIRCFAIAPARCVSLNLAVRYADIINSVALQVISSHLVLLPCLLCILCLKDTCTFDEKRLQDPRRLYAPGRLYHIIVRKPFRYTGISSKILTTYITEVVEKVAIFHQLRLFGTIPPKVRTALMMETERIMEIPAQQRMERQVSLAREHSEEYKAALQRAVALDVPEAYSPSSYGTFDEINEEGDNCSSSRTELPFVSSKRRKENWDDLAGRLFDIDESGQMELKK
ncbi:hypothetical protein C3L33_07974, partial [Rhododendron williamsianum]